MHKLLSILSLTLMLTSCYYPDSENVRYEVNDNFLLTADSILLQAQQPLHTLPVDTMSAMYPMYKNEAFVVAQILVIPEDSIDSVWVKVAHDQQTMGWIHQTEFLTNSIPDDPISSFIYIFSISHLWYFVAIGILAILLIIYQGVSQAKTYHIFIHDIPSFYPTMLVLTLSGSAVIYASMQKFVPDTWAQYYFHPTLNPFELPFILGLFIASVWLLVVLFIATVDEVSRQLSFDLAIPYMFTLIGVCMACYLIFSFAATYWMGCILFLCFAIFAVWRYFHFFSPKYLCKKCGAKMHSKGKCAHCGKVNP